MYEVVRALSLWLVGVSTSLGGRAALRHRYRKEIDPAPTYKDRRWPEPLFSPSAHAGEAMELFLFCVLSLITHVLGQQSLMQVLSSNLDLVTLYHYVNASASLTNLFSSLNGVTLLAPSNAAFSNLLESRSGEALSDAELQELLQYHILDGNFTTKSWSSKPQFVPTFLKDPKYTNVTGGQVVELITDGHGNPQILSWNKTVSTILTPVTSCIPKILWPL
jgi:hypothetical protein